MANVGKISRASVFSSLEKTILLDCVERHINILENKKTDSVSNATKKETWLKVFEDFNSSPSVEHRDVCQLKKCWENLKRRVRDIKTEDKRSLFATGGGPPSTTQRQTDGIMNRVEQLTPFIDEQIMNVWDSDGVAMDVNKEETGDKVDIRSSITICKPTIGKPPQIQVPSKANKSSPIKTIYTDVYKRPSQKRTATTTSDELVEERLKFVKLQCTALERELQMKEEEHALKLNVLMTKFQFYKQKCIFDNIEC